MASGQLDVYVEYTGTALTDILKRPVRSRSRARSSRTVRAAYRALGLRVGAPLGFNNTFALVMRRAEAERRGIARISDLAPHAAILRVGLFGEFLERAGRHAGAAADLRLPLRPAARSRWTSACSIPRSPRARSTSWWAARPTA